MQETCMGSQPQISTRTSHKPGKWDLNTCQGSVKDRIQIENKPKQGLNTDTGLKQGSEA